AVLFEYIRCAASNGGSIRSSFTGGQFTRAVRFEAFCHVSRTAKFILLPDHQPLVGPIYPALSAAAGPSTVARPTLDSEVGAPAITVQRSDPEGAPRSDTSWATATSCTRCGVPSCAPTASMGSGRIDPLFRGVVAGHALLNGD